MCCLGVQATNRGEDTVPAGLSGWETKTGATCCICRGTTGLPQRARRSSGGAISTGLGSPGMLSQSGLHRAETARPSVVGGATATVRLGVTRNLLLCLPDPAGTVVRGGAAGALWTSAWDGSFPAPFTVACASGRGDATGCCPGSRALKSTIAGLPLEFLPKNANKALQSASVRKSNPNVCRMTLEKSCLTISLEVFVLFSTTTASSKDPKRSTNSCFTRGATASPLDKESLAPACAGLGDSRSASVGRAFAEEGRRDSRNHSRSSISESDRQTVFPFGAVAGGVAGWRDICACIAASCPCKW
mmetsp:Transcript_4836/g.11825  ORF Transcript_4836/g.11825 Transcript_4836/m.11825 type:complete len:303 (-) Transcript_4836:308-1216(-)